jgi:hypothetical protein
MVSAVETKDMAGTLQFDEEKRHCYIIGEKYHITPMFDFFNEFINLQELLVRAFEYNNEEEVNFFSNNMSRWEGYISRKDFYTMYRERFNTFRCE